MYVSNSFKKYDGYKALRLFQFLTFKKTIVVDSQKI